ncbi:MAG: hypothetical protein QM796_20395 [Chthoniobacteraceae bacterium]
MNKDIPTDIAVCLVKWPRIAVWLRLLFIFLVLVSVSCSLVVTTFTMELSPLVIKCCSFAAAPSLTLLSSMDIAGKANRVRTALRQLTAARLRFETEESFSARQLISAYAAAEAVIGDVNYIPQNTADDAGGGASPRLQ